MISTSSCSIAPDDCDGLSGHFTAFCQLSISQLFSFRHAPGVRHLLRNRELAAHVRSERHLNTSAPAAEVARRYTVGKADIIARLVKACFTLCAAVEAVNSAVEYDFVWRRDAAGSHSARHLKLWRLGHDKAVWCWWRPRSAKNVSKICHRSPPRHLVWRLRGRSDRRSGGLVCHTRG